MANTKYKIKDYTGRKAHSNGPPCMAIDPYKAYHYTYHEYDIAQYTEDDEWGVVGYDDLYTFWTRISLRDDPFSLVY